MRFIVDNKTKYIDWTHRNDIKGKLKMDLILVLAEHVYPPVPKDEVFKEIFEQVGDFAKYAVRGSFSGIFARKVVRDRKGNNLKKNSRSGRNNHCIIEGLIFYG